MTTWKLTLVCAVLTCKSAFGGIITFDNVADFSLATNTESSTWSYRFADDLVRDGAYSLLTHVNPIADPFPTKPDVWNNSGDGAPTYLGVNLTGAQQSSGGGVGLYTWNANEMIMHPETGGLVILSWLSPATGIATIDFSFADAIPFGDSNWFVDRNGSAGTLDSGFLSGGASSGTRQVTTAVTTGDRINFVVAPNGGFAGDAIAIAASISLDDSAAVPEPSAFSMVLFASPVLIAVSRWRRRNRPSSKR